MQKKKNAFCLLPFFPNSYRSTWLKSDRCLTHVNIFQTMCRFLEHLSFLLKMVRVVLSLDFFCFCHGVPELRCAMTKNNSPRTSKISVGISERVFFSCAKSFKLSAKKMQVFLIQRVLRYEFNTYCDA